MRQCSTVVCVGVWMVIVVAIGRVVLWVVCDGFMIK